MVDISRTLCAAATVLLLSAAPGFAADTATPDIPKVSVRFGNGMFLPHTESIIGLKQNWFKDVGITLTPEPNGSVLPSAQGASSLISGTVDVVSAGVYKLLPAMDKARNLRIFVQKDIYSGFRVMAQPDKGYKSYEEFVKSGLKPMDSLKAVINEMKKGKVGFEAGAEKTQFFDLLFKAAGYSNTEVGQLNNLVIDDAQSTALMIAGRLDFQLGGAPAMTELTSRGFKPLVTAFDLAGNAETLGEAAALAVLKVGWGTTQEYYERNHDTILRLASVYFRIAKFIKDHPKEAAEMHGPFLNSVAGSRMSVATVLTNYKDLDKFYTFEEQRGWYMDPNDPFYYRKEVVARIHDAEKNGLLAPGSMDPEVIMIADDVYKELLQLKDGATTQMKEADRLIASKRAGADKAAALLKTARAQYDAYNFLDAKRFADAAVSTAK
jgi:ABC-type nitrate/sulfonate/bicarbonate transport system substrate-binding protein/predicted CopG family antitoxin